MQRGDTPSSGLAPPAPEETGHSGVTESSAEQTRFCVKCREGDKGREPLKTAQHDRVVQRTSVRVCLYLSSVAGTSRLCSERWKTEWSCRRASASCQPPTPRTKPANKLPAYQSQGRVVQDRAVPQARACQKVSRPSGPDRAAWQTSVCADIFSPSGHVQEFVGILTWGIAAVCGCGAGVVFWLV